MPLKEVSGRGWSGGGCFLPPLLNRNRELSGQHTPNPAHFLLDTSYAAIPHHLCEI